MLNSIMSSNNMMVSPHWVATQIGIDIMRSGGNAVEAMIASAAAISVAYPHMNSMGGDNFWLIKNLNKKVFAIEATGASAQKANRDFYISQGHNSIPTRGGLAALTVPGAVGGWENAFNFSKNHLEGKKSLQELLEPAEQIAKHGVLATNSLVRNLNSKKHELANINEFYKKFYKNKNILVGKNLKFPELEETFKTLKKNGLNDFYHGKLNKRIISDLSKTSSPLSKTDFHNYRAINVEPISLKLQRMEIFNLPPPTQGLASLLIMGILDKIKDKYISDFHFVHSLVEATKIAFKIRNKYICDPRFMKINIKEFLNDKFLVQSANKISFNKTFPWSNEVENGDTVWLGAADKFGNVVSFIQSIYWEFGSGIFSPETGIIFQNRGISFSLDKTHHNFLIPNKKPFHTIQPALAILNDGRTISYGTMGGDGQPQTQATILSRYIDLKMSPQHAINTPRWLLGRTWGDNNTNLKLEDGFDKLLITELKKVGHEIELVSNFNEIMGHAGMIVRNNNGNLVSGYDLRSDGMALGN